MLEVMKNKRLLKGLLTLGFACALPGLAQAAGVIGVCSNCHTMHDSQHKVSMTPGAKGPNAVLLTKDCAGCHADGTTNTDQWLLSVPTPQVGSAGTPYLAGGYFGTTQSQMHNVYDINSADNDTSLTGDPPGWEAGVWSGYTANKMVGCYGSDYTTGCHRSGGHHANNAKGTEATGTTIGTSFRFLSGIKGFEDTDWEKTKTSAAHNQYYAIIRAKGAANGSTQTINQLCAGCHGNFHGQADQDNGTAWIRHPTDVDIAAYTSTSEYAAYSTYQPTVPVGSLLVNQSYDQPGTPNYGIVLCLSCHRAHGSPYADLLRWNYARMVAGTSTASDVGQGCFVCHSTKDP